MFGDRRAGDVSTLISGRTSEAQARYQGADAPRSPPNVHSVRQGASRMLRLDSVGSLLVPLVASEQQAGIAHYLDELLRPSLAPWFGRAPVEGFGVEIVDAQGGRALVSVVRTGHEGHVHPARVLF